jgi:sterol desaturase/sphingolipid hydroxylase (fatty acid hydroxylase superfamily)
MPNPIDLLLDPVSLIIMAIYLLLMAWEAFFPARKLPVIRFWRFRGIVSFFVFFFISSYLPILWAAWLPDRPLINLSAWGAGWGAVAGVLLYEFGMYVWHRSMHRNSFLWRIFHQMHHSAERLDTYGAFYFSPMDMIGWTALSTVCFSVLLGLEPQAITIILLLTNFLGMFQHANIQTPQWLGYLVQRPESHTVHHARGIHAYNYADLPVFDLLFGTFRNPKQFEHSTGFYEGASNRIGEMLAFREVDKWKG